MPEVLATATATATATEHRVRELLDDMTLDEKIGQLNQVNGAGGTVPDDLRAAVAAGAVGSVLNEVDRATVDELQRIALEDSRLGIPLLVGRDVIHGFRTVFPIPLGQAASFNPDLVSAMARVAAMEASAAGVNWTFAPMIDVCRDPRWGRIAEGFGEDPWLTGMLGAAMVRGFQGDDLTAGDSVLACAKHFAGYGACEAGKDYNTTNIPENELRNVHLPPFRQALAAGALTLMASFSDLDGVPATGNRWLLHEVLRGEWGFAGMVVSDWEAISQLVVHGLVADNRAAVQAAATAGVDMDMASGTYSQHLAELVADGSVPAAVLDAMVANLLRTKIAGGLFERRAAPTQPDSVPEAHFALAREAAVQGTVLLQNHNQLLPLAAAELQRVALLGPLADAHRDQLGTWIFDGDPELSQTPLAALQQHLAGQAEVVHVAGTATTRSRTTSEFAEAVAAAEAADVVVICLGEEAILSGEAHCRADIDLPGNQADLLSAVAATGTPVVLVLMAGRPLTIAELLPHAAAVLWAWHPGTMAGPALVDLLFGDAVPSGRLPVTFPQLVGQVPVYHAHKRTGKPPTPETVVHIDDIDAGAAQLSVGNTSFHLDAGDRPLFPFGFGLSYSSFAYSDLRLVADNLSVGAIPEVQVTLTNTGSQAAVEVAQLYVADLVGSVTRPVREFKGCQRIHLGVGESQVLSFLLPPPLLAFADRRGRRVVEPGTFHVWIGGNADADQGAPFTLTGEPLYLDAAS